MNSDVFKKMRLKPGTTGIYQHAPDEYVQMVAEQDLIDFSQREKAAFVHLFVSSEKELHERIAAAVACLSPEGILWISYPKSTGKQKYDINRDRFFLLMPAYGFEANGNVAVDGHWSAVRFRRSQSAQSERP